MQEIADYLSMALENIHLNGEILQIYTLLNREMDKIWKEDINVSKRFKKKIAGFSPEVLDFFEGYHWPGNVRQLLHEIERLLTLYNLNRLITITTSRTCLI